MNFPIWKCKEGEKPILVHDMVHNAMLGAEWVECEQQEAVVKRGPGRPRTKAE